MTCSSLSWRSSWRTRSPTVCSLKRETSSGSATKVRKSRRRESQEGLCGVAAAAGFRQRQQHLGLLDRERGVGGPAVAGGERADRRARRAARRVAWPARSGRGRGRTRARRRPRRGRRAARPRSSPAGLPGGVVAGLQAEGADAAGEVAALHRARGARSRRSRSRLPATRSASRLPPELRLALVTRVQHRDPGDGGQRRDVEVLDGFVVALAQHHHRALHLAGGKDRDQLADILGPVGVAARDQVGDEAFGRAAVAAVAAGPRNVDPDRGLNVFFGDLGDAGEAFAADQHVEHRGVGRRWRALGALERCRVG